MLMISMFFQIFLKSGDSMAVFARAAMADTAPATAVIVVKTDVSMA
jgi:hypothetical protein